MMVKTKVIMKGKKLEGSFRFLRVPLFMFLLLLQLLQEKDRGVTVSVLTAMYVCMAKVTGSTPSLRPYHFIAFHWQEFQSQDLVMNDAMDVLVTYEWFSPTLMIWDPFFEWF